MYATSHELEFAEDRLQQALRDSDVVTLDQLLDPDVVFVGPDGLEVDKQADLDSHRSGFLQLTQVTELRRSTRQFDNAGTTRVTLHLQGTIGGEPLDANLIYTRTWHFSNGTWQVMQAQGAIASATT